VCVVGTDYFAAKWLDHGGHTGQQALVPEVDAASIWSNAEPVISTVSNDGDV
jgi:hypothetical protein